jgi:PhoD-like phosphatase
MAELILGPLLRYVSDDEATVWVETDAPCEVEVLEARSSTFCICGHHYALVPIRDLAPGNAYEYEVKLDGRRVWPEDGSPFPPSSIRTLDPGAPLRIVFGSCRVAIPHRPPWTLTEDEDPDHGREIDALYALATRMRTLPPEEWPSVLLMLGDQVYVDEDAPATRAFIRSRRDTSRPPGEEVLDFEEYTQLYRESWGEPEIRWLLSTVSTSMIFDDHDVHDDWNTSMAWTQEMEAQPWWDARITSALMSYWIYQHLGNLAPEVLDENEVLQRVRAVDDAGDILRDFARASDHSTNGSRWSYRRDLGRTRLIVFDSREGRVLDPAGRKIVDDREWERVCDDATGGVDHLVLADTLPFLLSPGVHFLEAWNERVCAGAWGPALTGVGERIRRALDLEHWAAFGDSFHRMVELLTAVGAGDHGEPPATIIGLGGDVHHAYLAEVGFAPSARVKSAVYQAVCSPFRNALDRHERAVVRAGAKPFVGRLMRALARTAGARVPQIGWRLVQDPTFDNQFATLDIDGRRAVMRLEKIVPGNWRNPEIQTSLERRLA